MTDDTPAPALPELESDSPKRGLRIARLTAPVDRLTRRMAYRAMEEEKSYVEDPGKLRGLFWRGVVCLLAGWAAILGMIRFPDAWPGIVGAAVAAASLGAGALHGLARARAYRNGWLAGRLAMVQALSEAGQRDMGLEDWLRGEAERDAEVIRWL